jgi:hypothetical protein
MLLWMLFLWMLAPVIALAQPESAATPDEAAQRNEARLEAMLAMASRYELKALGKDPRDGLKLERTAEPVQRWTNPIRGQLDGCLFLWTLSGRPQAVLTFYPMLEGTAWHHEFQSLALTPLVANYDNAEVWRPDLPGVEFKLVPGASAPADTATRRLSQMRSLARLFTASVDVRGEKANLRLLPAPVYRYGQAGHEPLDGAAFVFAQATDPELVLLLEAQSLENNPRWCFALARLTMWPLAVSYDSAPVWSVEKWIRAESHPKQTYFDRVVDPK